MRTKILTTLVSVVALCAFAPANSQVMQRKIPTATPQPAPDPASPPSDPATPAGAVPPDSPPAPAPRDVGAGSAVMPRIDKSVETRVGGGNLLSMMTGWERLPGCARRISIAASTQIYVTGCADGPDILIHHWNQDHWESTGASGVSVAAVYNLAQGGPGSVAPTYSGPMPITQLAITTGGLQERSAGGG